MTDHLDFEWNKDKTAMAAFSPDRRYRYLLGRTLREGNRYVTFIMLNPSTADALTDDATIRRCVGFTRDWGYDGLVVANLYAYRATHPQDLFARDPVERIGPKNNLALWCAVGWARKTVCAWGAHAEEDPKRWQEVYRMIKGLDDEALCLGTTAKGHPKHPLRLPKTTVPIPFLAK